MAKNTILYIYNCMTQQDGVTYCWDENLYEDCAVLADGTAHCGESSD